jgi:hypothetical protein
MAHARTDSGSEKKLHRHASNENARHPDNGTLASSEAQSNTGEDRMRRAEEMADRIGERIGQYASAAGLGILRFAVRAREELQDIWAEAQHLRRGEGS